MECQLQVFNSIMLGKGFGNYAGFNVKSLHSTSEPLSRVGYKSKKNPNKQIIAYEWENVPRYALERLFTVC